MRKKMIESKVVKAGCEEMLQCIENTSEGWERPKSYKTKTNSRMKNFLGDGLK
jgi:hypothetical protein